MGNVLIQGGRLRKTNRGIISFAPFLAGASMLALGALLATTSPVKAGTCDTVDRTTSERLCQNPASSADDAVYIDLGTDTDTQRAKTIRFNDRNGAFGLSVADDAGFIVNGEQTSGGVTISLSGPGDSNGNKIVAEGTDDNTRTLLTNNGDAIRIDNAGDEKVEINIIGHLLSEHGSGVQISSIHAAHTANANTNVTITGNIGASGAGNAVGKDGVYIFQNKPGSATVQVTGNIWAGDKATFNVDRDGVSTGQRARNGGRGVYVVQTHASGENAGVSVTGDIMSRGTGIHVENAGIGATSVQATGDVNSSQSNGTIGNKGIFVTTHSNSTAYKARISAKTVIARNEGIELIHRGGVEGRVEVTGTVISLMEEGIIVSAPQSSSGEGIMEDAMATHLSVKVGTKEVRDSGAASADKVESAKDGITVTHMGGTMATADVRSYSYITATNSTTGTDATGIKITMGKNTGSAIIMQEDNIFAGSPATTEITGVTVRVIADEEINAKTHGIHISHGGTGNVRIVSSCTTDTTTMADSCITTANGDGIRIDDGAITGMSGTTGDTSGTTGHIDITVNGEADRAGNTGTNRAIKSQANGIYLHQVGDGHAMVTVNGSIETTMGHGVLINRDGGAGNATVMVNADITAGGSSGTNNGRSAIDIHFIHDANPSTPRTTTGNIFVEIAEGVTVTGDHSPALDIGNFGGGDVTITVNGTVRRETTGDAGIVMSLGTGSSGSLRLILGDGAIVEDGRAISNRDIEAQASSPAVATIELTGTRELAGTDRDKVLDLGDISGFDNLEKTGSGTWKLTGAQDSGNTGHNNFALNELIVSEGTLVLDLDPPDGSEMPVLNFVCHKLNMDNTCPSENLPVITIAQGAVLQADEDISMGGDPAFNLGGNLFLSGADSEIDIGGLVATGTDASVTIDVEFPEAMEETDEADETEEEERPRFERARLNTGTDGDVTAEEAIVVDIMPLSTGGPPVSMDNLIRVGGTASLGEETFVAGNIVDSPVRLFLEHEEVEGVNVWNIIATQVGVNGGMGTIHDTFAATLSELSQPEMLYERLRDRKAKYGTNSWVKAYSANTQFTPEGSSFDIENAGFQIGLRAPMENILYQNWARNASFDASLEFGRAFSDALVASGTAEIHTETFAMGLGTTYNLDKFYIDGQLKYSYFENSLNAGTTRLASPSADSLAASIEFGSVLGGKGVSLGDIIGGVDAPGDPGIPNIELVPSLQVSWSSVDFGPYTSTTGIPVRLDDGDVFFGRVGMLAQGEWDNVHFLYDDFSVADVRLRGHVNFVAPLDAEVATEVMGMLITSKRVKPSLDAGIGIAYEWDDAYILHADITTQQGDEVEGYSGTIGFKHEF
ncbi:MAG: autotransporter outer membrane beta-barrel domain-containing protein [Hyphomicrobiales bacterium]|nr:autotransporter outer membrane beta-barrel domain-containing protein [Hyphomicrobiales bacterium]